MTWDPNLFVFVLAHFLLYLTVIGTWVVEPDEG